MSAGRVFGGLLALFAAFFVLIMIIIDVDAASAGNNVAINWFICVLLGVLALLSGFLGLASKSGGGIAIVTALIMMLLGLLAYLVADLTVLFTQYSLFQTYMSVGAWAGITLESIILLFGGIFMAASSP